MTAFRHPSGRVGLGVGLAAVVVVLALGLVVAAIRRGLLGHAVGALLPGGDGLGSLPLVAGAGTPLVLAALLGLTIGSGLTWTGSLANLQWRRAMLPQGMPAGSAQLHRVSLEDSHLGKP